MEKFILSTFGAGLLIGSLSVSALATPSNPWTRTTSFLTQNYYLENLSPMGTLGKTGFANPSITKVSVNSTSEFADCGVSFFSDTNFQGSKVVLVAGKYTLADLQAYGMMNDSISSIKIPIGYIVKVYQNNNFSGRSATLTADVQNLDDHGLNDAISSIQISIFQ